MTRNDPPTPPRRFDVPFLFGADPDPDHHLWRNGRFWWVAFTVHLPGWQKERVRLSLQTEDVSEARRRRDDVLRRYPGARGCALSLRHSPRRSGSRRDPVGTPQRAFAA